MNNKPCKDYKSIMIKKIKKSKDDVDEEVTQVIVFNNLTKLTILKLVLTGQTNLKLKYKSFSLKLG